MTNSEAAVTNSESQGDKFRGYGDKFRGRRRDRKGGYGDKFRAIVSLKVTAFFLAVTGKFIDGHHMKESHGEPHGQNDAR